MMSTNERITKLLRRALPGITNDREHAAMVAALADVESQVAAALVLYIKGDMAAVGALFGHPDTLGGAVAALPLLAAFDAASEAITSAVGDDPTRGMAALVTLQERSVEYAAAAQQLRERHAGNGERPTN